MQVTVYTLHVFRLLLLMSSLFFWKMTFRIWKMLFLSFSVMSIIHCIFVCVENSWWRFGGSCFRRCYAHLCLRLLFLQDSWRKGWWMSLKQLSCKAVFSLYVCINSIMINPIVVFHVEAFSCRLCLPAADCSSWKLVNCSSGGLCLVPEEVVWSGLWAGGATTLWTPCLSPALAAQPTSLLCK